jgi:hypothetical protein
MPSPLFTSTPPLVLDISCMTMVTLLLVLEPAPLITVTDPSTGPAIYHDGVFRTSRVRKRSYLRGLNSDRILHRAAMPPHTTPAASALLESYTMLLLPLELLEIETAPDVPLIESPLGTLTLPQRQTRSTRHHYCSSGDSTRQSAASRLLTRK